MEVEVPVEEVKEEREYADELGLETLSVGKRGPTARIMYRVPGRLSLTRQVALATSG